MEEIIEEWKPIEGYEDYYEVSNFGRVRRLSRIQKDSLGRTTFINQRVLKGHVGSTFYPEINLTKDGKHETKTIHRLVAQAFLPNPDNLPCVNHKDEKRNNNHVSNLEWCTYQHNNTYGTAIERKIISNAINSGRPPVIQYDLSGNVVGRYEYGAAQVKRELGIKIMNCLHHECATAGGYVWRYEGDPFSYTESSMGIMKCLDLYDESLNLIKTFKTIKEASEELGLERHKFTKAKEDTDGFRRIGGLIFKLRPARLANAPKTKPTLTTKRESRAICQYTKEGKLVATYPSAAMAGLSFGERWRANEILACCRKEIDTCRGFVWCFKDDEFSYSPKKRDYSLSEKRFDKNAYSGNHKNATILQYDFDGNLVAEHKSISEAAKSVSAKASNIVACCQGRQYSSNGFVWKYKDAI